MTVVKAIIAALVCLFIGSNNVVARLLDENCGTFSEDPYGWNIIGGNQTNILQNPWMALVLSSKPCGGSLITSRFVLTAAHCVLREELYYVRLGEYLTLDPEPYRVNNHSIPRFYNISADLKIIHNGFDCISNKNDIALLRMSKTVEYSDCVRPICLLVDEQLEESASYNAIGWGETESGQFSRVLLETTVHYMKVSYCTKKFERQIDQSQICAGSRTSNTCHGDSGGPLSHQLQYGNKNLTFQYGLVSYGTTICQVNAPAVYTNVSHHMNWILEKTAEFESNCSLTEELIYTKIAQFLCSIFCS
ncbi:serine protease grass [Drosophila teissieri]|uniref:serine protease grass n=1 Tax=Drosophila teissieri TaxID=7243 RepID=UPI001CB9DBD3|nr:serine protease grass [Drosophila teissieri]